LVSNDFPCFDIDSSKVLPHFFEWYSRTPEFVDLCRRASEGSTNRVRMKEDKFLKMSVPLLSLDEQRDIVQRLDDVSALVDERRRGIEASERETHAMLQKAFQRAIDGAPLRPMAKVAPLVRREIEIEPDQAYTEIGVRSFYNGIFHRRTLPGSEFSWQKLFTIKEGDLVFSNLMAWEKAIAVAAPQDNGTVGNHRMLTCAVDPAVAIPSFLMAYFRTADGFASVVGHSPGTIARNKTLSSKKLPTIEIPVPPLDTQLWFHQIQEKTHEVQGIRARTAKEIDGLMPALLHEIFGREASAP
jgi:type I restriction enzyme S subunit